MSAVEPDSRQEVVFAELKGKLDQELREGYGQCGLILAHNPARSGLSESQHARHVALRPV